MSKRRAAGTDIARTRPLSAASTAIASATADNGFDCVPHTSRTLALVAMSRLRLRRSNIGRLCA